MGEAEKNARRRLGVAVAIAGGACLLVACSSTSQSGAGDAGGGTGEGGTGTDGAGSGADGSTTSDGGAAPVVESTFASGSEGWQLSDVGVDLLFDPKGGNPNGGVRAELFTSTDPTSSVYFIAPPAFHGDRSALYGGRLHFDLGAPNFKDDFGAPAVVLFGGGTAVSWSDPPNLKSPGWLGVDVPLSAGHWNVFDVDVGLALAKDATESDLRAVLANLDDVRIIAGDFDSTADKVDLDNVALYAP